MENEMITLMGMGLGTFLAITLLIAGRAIVIAAAGIAERIAERHAQDWE